MTLVSNLSRRIFRSFARPDSTSLRMAGVISYCLPVYSTFIERPPGIRHSMIWTQTTVDAGVALASLGWAGETPALHDWLLLHSALVGTRDAHILPVFRNRAASDLDTLRLKDAGDLLVGQRPGWIFFVDELLHAALQDQQRGVAAFGPLHALGEKVPQFEHALWSVGVLVGHRAADGGGMDADFFGHLLDHHGFQLIDASFQKILLARDDRVTDLGDRLLALLDVLDQLDCALVAFFHVIAGVFVVGVFIEEALVCRIQAKLRDVFVVHQAEPLVAVLHEGDIRLDKTRCALVVPQAWTRIEGLNELDCGLDRFDGASKSLPDFLVLLQLESTQVTID